MPPNPLPEWRLAAKRRGAQVSRSAMLAGRATCALRENSTVVVKVIFQLTRLNLNTIGDYMKEIPLNYQRVEIYTSDLQ